MQCRVQGSFEYSIDGSFEYSVEYRAVQYNKVFCTGLSQLLKRIMFKFTSASIAHLTMCMKRSRARVPIGGQCVLLKIIIEMFDFF